VDSSFFQWFLFSMTWLYPTKIVVHFGWRLLNAMGGYWASINSREHVGKAGIWYTPQTVMYYWPYKEPVEDLERLFLLRETVFDFHGKHLSAHGKPHYTPWEYRWARTFVPGCRHGTWSERMEAHFLPVKTMITWQWLASAFGHLIL